jgi:hypothetical protein
MGSERLVAELVERTRAGGDVMKVGDLISLKMKKTQPPQVPRHGLVLRTWRNHKGKLQTIDLMWAEGIIRSMRADLFEVLGESR